MAHTIKGKGPYPDKAGEFCGNHKPGCLAILLAGESIKDADCRWAKWLEDVRFGDPSDCKAGTSKEMKAKGWVGLYLKEDRSLFDWEKPVDTDELTEAVVTLTTPV